MVLTEDRALALITNTIEESLRLEECDDTESLLSHAKGSRTSSRLFSRANTTPGLLVISCIFILVQSFFLVEMGTSAKHQLLTPNGLSYKRTIPRRVYEHSKYLSHNEAEASQAWDSILAGHGVISLDADYIAQKNLPASVALPDGSGNFMYIIEAYHAIHCIKTIRAHYVALEQNTPWNWSRPHDMHCFDALRQYVMCNVDDTILWTTGHRESGTGQEKKCNDWNALREFAEKKSASYFDVEPGNTPHLNNYHKGDGLTW